MIEEDIKIVNEFAENLPKEFVNKNKELVEALFRVIDYAECFCMDSKNERLIYG